MCIFRTNYSKILLIIPHNISQYLTTSHIQKERRSCNVSPYIFTFNENPPLQLIFINKYLLYIYICIYMINFYNYPNSYLIYQIYVYSILIFYICNHIY